MVLKLGKGKVEPDPYLTQHIKTERFNLVFCNKAEALRITLPWAKNPEILHNLMYSKSAYTKFEWARNLPKPDGHKVFYHAIVAREIKGTIGTHRVKLDRSGTASMAIVVHTDDWHGEGVFEEVRSGILDHFSRSPRVVRFYGRVLSRNVSSVYNYKKLGFRLIGFDRKSWLSPKTGTLCDTMHFELLAEDWRAKRGLDLI